jgi:mRNA-degrading endonuclease RelE of RelBE toxin-antitoxin system
MKLDYEPRALKALEAAPAQIRNAFFKKVKLLEQNLSHPSLHAKKYDESKDIWQARINRGWRFYFQIAGDTYVILNIIPHPK